MNQFSTNEVEDLYQENLKLKERLKEYKKALVEVRRSFAPHHPTRVRIDDMLGLKGVKSL